MFEKCGKVYVAVVGGADERQVDGCDSTPRRGNPSPPDSYPWGSVGPGKVDIRRMHFTMTTVDQGVWEVGLSGLFSGAARRFEDPVAAMEGADIAFVRREN